MKRAARKANDPNRQPTYDVISRNSMPFHDAVADPCHGHECDHCVTCERGRCCRNDHAGYQLPAEGDWADVVSGNIYGEVGVLESDGHRVQCHACGEWYLNLGVHAWLSHNVTADEYRAVFGLGYGVPLAGQDYQIRMRSAEHLEHLRQIREEYVESTGFHSPIDHLTPEQDAEQKRRKRRTGVRKKMSAARKLHSNVHVMHTPEVAAKISAAKKGKYTPALQSANEERLARRIDVPCVICGKLVNSKPSVVHGAARGVTCSPECLSTLRSRVRSETVVTEETRQKISEAKAGIVTPAMLAWHERLRNGVEKTCEQCGATFYVPLGKAHTKRYCSAACRTLGMMRHVDVVCARCGKAFTAPLSRIPRYCSRECGLAALQESPCCKNGHPWTPETTVYANNRFHTRMCKLCIQATKERYKRKKAED